MATKNTNEKAVKRTGKNIGKKVGKTGAVKIKPSITRYNAQLVLNRAKCLLCGDVVTSYHIHDYVSCKCNKMAVDGGLEYTRRTGERNNIQELCVYSDAPFKVIRESFHRGGRGKDGTEPLKWVKLSEMSDSWLETCITYNKDRGMGDSFSSDLYAKEIAYRHKNKITVL